MDELAELAGHHQLRDGVRLRHAARARLPLDRAGPRRPRFATRPSQESPAQCGQQESLPRAMTNTGRMCRAACARSCRHASRGHHVDEKVVEELQFHQETVAERRQLAAAPDPREGDGDLRARARRQAGGRRDRRRRAQEGRGRSSNGARTRPRRGCAERDEAVDGRRCEQRDRRGARRRPRATPRRSRSIESRRDERRRASSWTSVTRSSRVTAAIDADTRGGGQHAGPDGKVEIIGPKSQFFDVVSLLHEQGKLHIEDLSKKIQTGEVPLDHMEVVARQQARPRSDGRAAHPRARDPQGAPPRRTRRSTRRARRTSTTGSGSSTPDELADEIATVIDEVEDRTSTLASSAHRRSSARSRCSRATSRSCRRSSRSPSRSSPPARSTPSRCWSSAATRRALEQLKAELDKITHKQCEIVSTDVDEDTTAAIVVFNRQYSEPVHKFLAMENVNQIRLPTDFQDMPFDVAYDEHQGAPASAARRARRRSASELEEMSEHVVPAARRPSATCSIDKIDEIEAIPKFGRTEYAFVITGWIPVDDVTALRKAHHRALRRRHHRRPDRDPRARVRATPRSRSRTTRGVAPFQTLLGVVRHAAVRHASTRRGCCSSSTRCSSA